MKTVIPLKGIATPRGRRHRPSAAAAAYSLALSVSRNPSEAELVAVNALRKGVHSRTAVLAHARHQALQRLGTQQVTTEAEVAAADIRDVALQLSGTRPGIERAIVDLELRFSLDAASFARVLGLPTERATRTAKTVADTWTDQLDPALVAWLGPGGCVGLEEVLTANNLWPRMSTGVHSAIRIEEIELNGVSDGQLDVKAPISDMTIGALLSASNAVGTHAGACAACTQRIKALVPVRTVVGQLAPEAVPTLVARAARSSRRRLPGPLPPSIEPRRIDLNRARSLIYSAAVVAGVAGLAIAGLMTVTGNRSDGQNDRVAKLLQDAPSSRLLGTPSVLDPETRTAALANNGDVSILWHATSSVPWLSVEPSNGRLSPAQSINLAVKNSREANDAETAIITINGSDGSVQTMRFEDAKQRTSRSGHREEALQLQP